MIMAHIYLLLKIFLTGVKGDFDFCQTAIKDIFIDEKYEQKMRIQLGYGLRWVSSSLSIPFYHNVILHQFLERFILIELVLYTDSHFLVYSLYSNINLENHGILLICF